MQNPNLPAIREDQSIVFPDLELALKQADVLIKSGQLPKAYDTPQKVVTVILKGRDLGLRPTIALEHLYPTGHGRVGMDGQMIEIMIRRAGHHYWVIERSDEQCVIDFQRRDEPEPYRVCVTMEEAKAAHWHENWDKEARTWKIKPTWETQPATMLFWRTLAKGAKQGMGDALNDQVPFLDDVLDAQARAAQGQIADEYVVIKLRNGQLDIVRREALERDQALLATKPRNHMPDCKTGSPAQRPPGTTKPDGQAGPSRGKVYSKQPKRPAGEPVSVPDEPDDFAPPEEMEMATPPAEDAPVTPAASVTPDTPLTPDAPDPKAWDKPSLRQFDAQAHRLFKLRDLRYSENDITAALGCPPEQCTIPYADALVRLQRYLDTVAKPAKPQQTKAGQKAML